MYILIGVISVTVLVTIVFILKNIGGGGSQQATLQFWGVFDDRNAFDKVIGDFKSQNPSIDVKYQMFTFEQYEQGFVNALASGTGPDILMIHNTWLPKHGDKLVAMPVGIPDTKNSFTVQSFRDQFVDVAQQDLVYDGKIFGMPLYADTLALYYNKDLLNSAGITRPPQTWEDVNAYIQLLSKFDNSGNIIQSGFSLGTARNIKRSTDILMTMMIQSGVRMTSDDNLSATFASNINGQPIGEIALQYYTNFANPRNPNYSWNDSQHFSIDSFTESNLAMTLGYAHDLNVIRSKAPRLNFAVAPMPQASISDVRNFANYWAVAVAAKSTYPVESWKFVNYLASREGVTTYLNATNRPSARRDLIDLQRGDLDLGIFAVQALTARSWFQPDNVAIEGIFADMIEDVNFNRFSIKDALGRAESRVNVLIRR